MTILHYYRKPALSEGQTRALLELVREKACSGVSRVKTEYCFNVETSRELSKEDEDVLYWLLSETFDREGFSRQSFLGEGGPVLEVGPRLNFSTAWSSNAVSVFHACGLRSISRIERFRRFELSLPSGEALDKTARNKFYALVHDRMTETPYEAPLESFDPGISPEPVRVVPVMEEGRSALEGINAEMGLGFDEADLDYYTDLFRQTIGRNPTNVECFDMGQSNSEHSRHWFFGGRLIVDGKEVPGNLLGLVKEAWKANPKNSVIAFSDNSSAIRGFEVRTIQPSKPGGPSPFKEESRQYHILFTAETHNFPTGVAPFPGAETGTGGRIREVQGTGTGGLVVAGTAA